MKINHPVKNTASWLLILLIGGFLLFPLYWIFVTSFKDNMDIYRFPPRFIPLRATLGNYLLLFRDSSVILYLTNNLFVSAGTTLLTLAAASLAGYSLSRYPSRFGRAVATSLLSTQMFPIVGLILALYVIFRNLGLIDSRLSLVLSLSAVTIPFCTILIKGFFDDIPRSLEEAARIDGASRMKTLLSVIMPLSKPGLLAIGLYTFMQAWDDFLFAITFILNDGKRTLSAGIAMKFLGEVSYDWGMVTTVSVAGVLPMFLLIFLFQKYMVAGLTAGAVKG
ncbi:MAG: carbohydrate ABC transporter permease [Spirochaetales bacterium]|nr:carbohydrate ABC transporter permease [Spirochaetales bacterium]